MVNYAQHIDHKITKENANGMTKNNSGGDGVKERRTRARERRERERERDNGKRVR